MSRNLFTVIIVICAVSFIAGCKGGDDIEVKSGLVARLDDEVIKERELKARMKSLPYSQKKKYEGEAGRAELVDEMIKERVLYKAALENKIQNKESIRTKLDYARRAILIKAYYGYMAEKMECTDKEIKEYYDNHQLEFKNESTVRAQHIFSRDSLKAAEWKKRIESSDDPHIFNKIAKKESEDLSTSQNNGILGYFNPYGYINFVGKDRRFGNAVEWLSEGQISDVISYDKGYSIVKVLEKRPATIKPLSEVREDIIRKIKNRKIKEVIENEIKRLQKKYNAVNYLRQELIKNTRSAKELWELAQEEESPNKKIIYYRAISNGYPDHKFAPQSLFMIAFTYSEELSDYVFARRALNELFEKYPDSEIIESAKWLKENMGKNSLKLDSTGSIKKESAEE
ncbi:MAG: peptidyl-prolyl cis-trans isomerase [Candidatus Krumholzibacteriota bacterium]|nr:peptidyl-prolyl cis-trans isomerase [Candidatus Krumholzibacteriota bacterium]